MDRAYSTLSVKTVNDEQRLIEGIASTPATDRMGDVVESMGAVFQLPLPLLWQHQHDAPVGHVEFAKPTKDGIPFRARIAQIVDPGELKDSIDKAWQAVKAGLVRGVSIGFKPIEYNFMKDGGIHFEKWNWLELSLVTIPANQDATIQTIKSIDSAVLAAIGNKRRGGDIGRPAAVGMSQPVSKGRPAMARKSLAEQISALEQSRSAKTARMEEIQQKAADEDRTKDESEREEFETLGADLDAIEKEIGDLRRLDAAMATTARAVAGHNSQAAGESRSLGRPHVTYMRDQLPPGMEFTRYVMCLVAAKMDEQRALRLAEVHYPDNARIINVLRAQSEARLFTKAPAPPLEMGDPATSPVAQYQQITNDFITYLMPQTIVGKLGQGNVPGPFRVPFNIRVPRQTSAARGWWVGEGQAKPVTGFTMDTVTLRPTKVANIVAVTEEFFRFGQFAAEEVVRRVMSEALVYTIDNSFIDPMNAGTPDVEPPSITNGATPIPSSGADFDAARADLAGAITALGNAELSYGNAVWIMNSAAAAALMLMSNALSQPAFPGFTPEGGLLLGRPVIISNVIEATGTPATSIIVLVIPSEIYVADDGSISVDMSREASLELNDAPTGTAANVSLWQANLVGLRAERFINWMMRRDDAVQVITGVAYAL